MDNKQRLADRLEALREEIEKKRIEKEKDFSIPSDEEWESMKEEMRNGNENDQEFARQLDRLDDVDNYKEALEKEHSHLENYLSFQEYVSNKLKTELKNSTPSFERISYLKEILERIEFQKGMNARLAAFSDSLYDCDGDTPPSVPM